MPDSYYRLPAVVDMNACAQLHKHLLEQLAQAEVVMDASGVERIATPGIQCLISAQHTLQAGGKSLSVLNPSPSFALAVADLSLQATFTVREAQA